LNPDEDNRVVIRAVVRAVNSLGAELMPTPRYRKVLMRKEYNRA
jgi:hypothetical protein